MRKSDCVYSFRFAEEAGLTVAECGEIEGLFRDSAVRWQGLGFTHFTYRSVRLADDGTDVDSCDLMFAHPDWIAFYYDRHLSPIVSGICQSLPTYKLSFFTTAKLTISPKYTEIIEQSLRHGMFYDCLYHFRNNQMSGGGFSGGRRGEKLGKNALYAAMGVAVELHEEIKSRLGVAAERTLGLTDNEVKYLQLMFYGLSPKEIALTSGVSQNWVAKVCMNARRKLRVTSNAAAVAKATGLHVLR